MAKHLRKQQLEIDRCLKLVDQGMAQLELLKSRMENANSIQMKEKYETELKKELKKLQLHRNFFRQLIKDQELKDSKRINQLQEVCSEIEDQMEEVRDIEREYKNKKLNKQVYLALNEVKSKFKDGDSSDDNYQSQTDSCQSSPEQSPTSSTNSDPAQTKESQLESSSLLNSNSAATSESNLAAQVSQNQPLSKHMEPAVKLVQKPLFETKSPFSANGLQGLPKLQDSRLGKEPTLFGGLPKLGAQSEHKPSAQSYQSIKEGPRKPPQTLSSNETAQQRQSVADLLEASLANKPEWFDQQVEEPAQLCKSLQQHKYPRVPLFLHEASFEHLDLHALLFAFYFSNSAREQVLASVQLKRKNWRFSMTLQSWFCLDNEQDSYRYFDPHLWQERTITRDSIDLAAVESEVLVLH